MNPVIIKNTKKYKKIQLQITKKYNTEQGKIINKRKIQHTLMDSRFCSFTPCLKNAKNTKGLSAICEGLEKYKKKYKNTNCIFGRNGNIQKNTKIQRVFFLYFIWIVSYFFLYFYKKYENIQKIQKKYECNCPKIQNTKKIRINNFKNTIYKKNTNQQFQKYKIQKKIRTQNFKNTKYKEKKNSKISQRANPVFTFGNQEPKYKKKYKTNQLYFPNPQF